MKTNADIFNEHVDGPFAEETLLVIKVHLLVERVLHDFLANAAINPSAIGEAKLSFAQTLALARAFSKKMPPDSWQWSAIKQLNSIRNLLAHQLESTQTSEKINALIEFISNRRELPPYDLSSFYGKDHPDLEKINYAVNSHPRFVLFDLYTSTAHILKSERANEVQKLSA